MTTVDPKSAAIAVYFSEQISNYYVQQGLILETRSCTYDRIQDRCVIEFYQPSNGLIISDLSKHIESITKTRVESISTGSRSIFIVVLRGCQSVFKNAIGTQYPIVPLFVFIIFIILLVIDIGNSILKPKNFF